MELAYQSIKKQREISYLNEEQEAFCKQFDKVIFIKYINYISVNKIKIKCFILSIQARYRINDKESNWIEYLTFKYKYRK